MKKFKYKNNIIKPGDLKQNISHMKNFNVDLELKKNYDNMLDLYVENKIKSSDYNSINENSLFFAFSVKEYFREIENSKIILSEVLKKTSPLISYLILEKPEEDFLIHDQALPSVNKLASKYGVSPSTMRRYLQKYKNMTYKSMSSISHKSDNGQIDEDVAIFVKEYTKIKSENNLIIWIDEANFNSCKRQRKNWIIKGDNNRIYTPGHIFSMNLIVAATEEKVIYYELHAQTININVFTNFLKNLKNSIFLDTEYSQKLYQDKVYLVMDNCPIHFNKTIQFNLYDYMFNFLFISKYCPYFNVIEFIFRTLKSKYYREFIYSK